MHNPNPRRSFLKISLLGAAALAAVGTGYQLTHPDPGPAKYTLDDNAKMVLAAVIPVLLQGALVGDPTAAIQQSMQRVQTAISSLPLLAQQEVADLFKLLALGPARRWLAGVDPEWREASHEQIHGFLQSWRVHRSPTLQTAYMALHDLVLGTWYGDESTWERIGYPGPIKELR
ncbi:MAG: hypothetical protein RL748_3582 [Pseudomonadota bacterium]|jgi:hypothetical protein